jgi:ribosomal protein S13
MTTTSQALSGVEAAKYKQICDKVATLSQAEQEALRKEQAAIVSEAIKSDASAQSKVQAKMADLIRQKILGNPKFNR